MVRALYLENCPALAVGWDEEASAVLGRHSCCAVSRTLLQSAPLSLHAGVFHGPDLCCREHDQCPQTISPLQYNYGIRNFRLHTISHCDCDARLAAVREGLGLGDRTELPGSWV